MTKIGDNSGAVDAGHLLAFIERIERVQSEIDELNGDKSEIFKEVKSAGYDAKVVKEILKIRRQEPEKLSEFETVLALYKSELGMA